MKKTIIVCAIVGAIVGVIGEPVMDRIPALHDHWAEKPLIGVCAGVAAMITVFLINRPKAQAE